MKAGNKKFRKTGCFRAKTPKTDLWHYGLGHLRRQPWSHSPETGFSKRGLPHFPGIFQVSKSVILKILRRAFEQPQVSPGRERIYFRQMFTVDPKNWCPNVQIRFHLSRTGDFAVISTWLLRPELFSDCHSHSRKPRGRI